MADVSAEAGVSAQTVSRALSQPDLVTPETRARVEQAVRKTGYVRNLAASHLASNRSHTVAAIVPTIASSVFSDTLRAVGDRLAPEGYQMFVGNTDYREGREEELVGHFIQRRPDGFVMVGTSHTRETRRLLEAYGRPVVETWDWDDAPTDLLVGFSNRRALASMVEHLVARGHRRLAFAGVLRPGDERAIRRFEGFRDAVADLLPDEPLRVVDLPDLPVAMDTGVELLRATLQRYPEITALVFPTDVFATAALLAAPGLGIDVPGRLAITGFGDFDLASHVHPGLTTVAIDVDRMGTTAADLLLARMREQQVGETAVDVGYRIEVRDSA
ncbi:LacI family DNA-binding transcriptional regulator [Nocardioides hwasunensis]|uniref:LacI family DNA-binding transcriptional regulator n=1 Tax=Nocardioides hwasunensis TaxID=397258 RepID=A0ABR8MHW9_9ACTN|nr:LacI family DNA-binding transcriptional regulator [Nocardioides hwasunensis]MBD3915572.1 LacI family DNA-binding transcriptional regulator [Nocardioides hwasunensis]